MNRFFPPLLRLLTLLMAVCFSSPSWAKCSFSVIRVVPDGVDAFHPAVTKVKEALASGRFGDAATTVEVGEGDRSDLAIHVGVVNRWGQDFLVLDRKVGALLVASQTIPWGGGGEASGDVLLALRSLVPCANTPPELRVSQEPAGRVPRGTELVLDACPSKDEDGDTLSFTWEQIPAPGVDPVTLPDPRRCRLEGVRLPREGVYRFQVAARDGVVTSTRTVEVLIGGSTTLRWRLAEGGAVGQDAEIQAVLWDGNRAIPPENLVCEVLSSPQGARLEMTAAGGSCRFSTPRSGTFRIRLSSLLPDGQRVASLAEVWVAPRTAVSVRGDSSLGALLTVFNGADLDASILARSYQGEALPAAGGFRLGVRFLLMGQGGLSWYPGQEGLSAQSWFLGADLLGFTRFFDPYRAFSVAPRQFGLLIGYESWALLDQVGSPRRSARLAFVEFRFEALRGLHVGFRGAPFGEDKLFSVQIGLSMEELIGFLGSRRGSGGTKKTLSPSSP